MSYVCLSLIFFLFSCSGTPRQEAPAEELSERLEEEWNTLINVEERQLTSDLLPEPQEIPQ